MKKKLLLLTILLASVVGTSVAQRKTDKLDRGLVAVKTSKGVFCSWRIPAEEYYDVQYNIYRDGTKINSAPLSVSNYLDASGTTGNTYTVEPVVRGVAQSQSAASSVWSNNYLEVKMDHGDLTSTYVPNDACCADVDGDGQVEILLKFDNRSDASQGYLPAGYNGEYALIEVYKLNGKKLWWIDLGPNMADFQNNENNIVAFDWDRDGKAEAVMRAADGTTIHTAAGKTIVIGDKSKNYRASGGASGQWFIHEGAEYLLYLNGETGEVYQQMEYPLKRLEDGETNLEAAWGDGYGHRSTKHFFGAPFLDGKKASIFLARGIYTRHKMVAFDVDPATHQLTERWRWVCNASGPWYGQGYHNYSIADVDMDGRDEIVYGSMVIDDNGKGLSTTGLGHGDAHHVGDFDPYSWGLEVFACNEDKPCNNFRDATTSKIYYRATGSADDGRSVAGNFLDEYPGAQGRSAKDGNIIGGASHKALVGAPTSGISTNFRIYWDGDLLEETFNYVNGKNTEGGIYKGGKDGAIATLTGSMTNNDTKGTPCYQGDVFGDWREEVIMRTADNNIRIYTTNIETPWRNYTLWHDHQYRNAMVWQMCGYNQPPHASYFLGQLEGITIAPPPLTTEGRTEIANGGTIGTDCNDKHIMTDETGDMTVAVTDGATPYIYTDNTPSHVEGTAPSNCTTQNTAINYTYYTHTLTGGAFAGSMRLVKQGEGTLVLPNVVEKYTGNTDVWNGTLSFDGTLLNSPLWLNRHTTLISDGGKFPKGIRADYNATIIPGGKDKKGSIETDSLKLGFGSRVQIDLFGEDVSADNIKANTLVVEKKDWANGPQYLAPVLTFVPHTADGATILADGKYLIGEIGKVEGSLDDIILEGIDAYKHSLVYEDGKLYVSIAAYQSGNVIWKGNESGVWDLDATANFVNPTTQEASKFVRGDEVTFDDNAVATEITVTGKVAPSKITFNNDEKQFYIKGDSIIGDGEIVKNGEGTVVIANVNHVGNTTINSGNLIVASLANNIGQDYGSLGGVNSKITIDNNATLTTNVNNTTTQTITVGTGGATIEVGNSRTLTMSKGIGAVNASTAVLTKTGAGSLTLGTGNRLSRLIIKAGNVNAVEGSSKVQLPATVEFVNGTLTDPSSENSTTTNSTNFVVPELCSGYLVAKPRCSYTGSLTGAGTFTVYAAGVRNYFGGDWSKFEGTIIPAYKKRGSFDPSFDFTSDKGMPLATLQVNSGIEFKNNGKSVEIGAIDGEGTLSGTGTYTLGSNNSDFRFKGAITSPVKKAGTGVWDVSSELTGIGSITVSEGSLCLNSLTAKDLITSTAPVYVQNGATLLGRGGIVTSVYLRSGATLHVGTKTDDYSGEFRVTGLLTAAEGSIIEMNIKNAKNTSTSRSFLNVSKNLVLNATVNITLSPDYTPAVGDSIVLWNAGTLTGTPTINLPELPSGLYWDTSDLLTNSGTLRVTDSSSGIASATTTTPVHCRMFTVSGIMVAEFDATLGEAAAVAKKNATASGTYLLQISTARDSKTIKLSVR